MLGRRGLYPYQREGVAALVSRPSLLLADDMGTGKTVQSIAALKVLADRGELGNALVVAPTGLLAQWRQALSDWAPDLLAIRVNGPARERAWKWQADKRVYLTSYDTARNDLGVLSRRCWDVVVLDEAQRIKNRVTGVAEAMKRIPRERSWALTGTPLENREDDLASILEFARPNRDGARLEPLWPGPDLRRLQAETQLRRRKADVLADLPPKTVVRVPLELSGEQRRAYQAVQSAGRAHIRELGQSAGVMNVLEVIARLKQVCNFCPDSGRSVKAEDLRERMAELIGAGHRALVFSQWTNERFGVERIAGELRAFAPLTYTGALSLSERDRRVAAFKADRAHGALILSLRAGGQGLNLQEVSYVIHFDRWWNPAVENQATDRAHRLGQREPVTVYCYTCLDSIEERIEAILDEKRSLFAAIVDGVSMDLGRALAPEELFGLLDLPAPARLRGRHGPAEPDLPARVAADLERAGWSVRRRPADNDSRIVLKARREDEVGAREELWLGCAEDGACVGEADVRAVASALGSRSGVAGAIVHRAEVTPPARELAETIGVQLWSVQDRP